MVLAGLMRLSGLWFALDVGKILSDKGMEAACHCRFRLTSLPEVSPLVSADFGFGCCTLLRST